MDECYEKWYHVAFFLWICSMYHNRDAKLAIADKSPENIEIKIWKSLEQEKIQIMLACIHICWSTIWLYQCINRFTAPYWMLLMGSVSSYHQRTRELNFNCQWIHWWYCFLLLDWCKLKFYQKAQRVSEKHLGFKDWFLFNGANKHAWIRDYSGKWNYSSSKLMTSLSVMMTIKLLRDDIMTKHIDYIPIIHPWFLSRSENSKMHFRTKGNITTMNTPLQIIRFRTSRFFWGDENKN